MVDSALLPPSPAGFLVFAEARFDFKVATLLADRVLQSNIQCAAHELEALRKWRGLDAQEFVKWTTLKKMWQETERRRPRLLHGKYGGPGPKGEYQQVRKAVLFAKLRAPDCQAVVLVRDSDGGPRNDAFRHARDEMRTTEQDAGKTVVIAVPIPEVESWLVSAWTPETDTEHAELKTARAELGFNPVMASHRLSSKREKDQQGMPVAKSAKNVLDRLTASDEERQLRGLDSDLEQLRERGASNGLTKYLEEAEALATHVAR